jgi:hypothetical protein
MKEGALFELKRVFLKFNLFSSVEGTLTASSLFVMVPVLSSAARIPLPAATRSRAVISSSLVSIYKPHAYVKAIENEGIALTIRN